MSQALSGAELAQFMQKLEESEDLVQEAVEEGLEKSGKKLKEKVERFTSVDSSKLVRSTEKTDVQTQGSTSWIKVHQGSGVPYAQKVYVGIKKGSLTQRSPNNNQARPAWFHEARRSEESRVKLRIALKIRDKLEGLF